MGLKTAEQKPKPRLVPNDPNAWYKAVKTGEVGKVDFLLKHGRFVQERDRLGRTPLSFAAEFGDLTMVYKLARLGDVVDGKDSHGRTPLLYAAWCGNVGILDKLITLNATVDAKDLYGRTALAYAAERGHVDAVEHLLASGAAIGTKDYYYETTALSSAAQNGHVKVIAVLIESGAGVDDQDGDGRTALWYAAKFGHAEVATALIENGAAMGIKDNLGRTVLSYAAENGNLKVVQVLIERGDVVNYEDENGRNALWYAAKSGSVDITILLIDNGASMESGNVRTQDFYAGASVLSLAARYGYIEVVMELIKRNADIHAADNEGRTALWYAARFGHAEAVTELIKMGIPIDTKDNLGRTLLSIAAGSGHVEVVTGLLRLGEDINYKDTNGRTALWYAARAGKITMVVKLISLGADLHVKDSDGREVLWHAAEYGYAHVVAELIRNKAIVDTKDKDGRTELSYAAESGHVNVVVELLKHDVAVDAPEKNGRTALSFAAERGHVKVTAQLIANGAVVDAKDSDERTSLWYAARSGHVNVVTELIDSGAVIDAKDTSGRTALSLAAERGRVAVIAELVLKGAAVDAEENGKRTALSYAAERGHVEVVAELIASGSPVDIKDTNGKAELSYAAESGHLNVVVELIKSGADVGATDKSGRSAIWFAASCGYISVVEVLIKKGIAVYQPDNFGQTALSQAIRNGHQDMVAVLLQHTAFDQSSNSSDTIAVFAAAAVGDIDSVQQGIVSNGVPVDSTTNVGKTPLFYAAEFGHADVVQFLIDNGASASQPRSSYSKRINEPPLSHAGRSGYMRIFRMLVEAGAPVNICSSIDRETPLVSAARWDYFAGVQLLVAHGGSFRFKDVGEYESPLIPGTLETMAELCRGAFEFGQVCGRVVERLREICSQLQESSKTETKEDSALVSFTSIVFRVCKLQLEIEKRQSPLSRFVGSRVMTSRIQDFHEELDHFAELYFIHDGCNWRDHFDEDVSSLQLRFRELFNSDKALVDGLDDDALKLKAAVLLQYELNICRRESRPEEQESIRRILDRFLRACAIEAPEVPDWFISRDDVEFHSWNLVRSEQGIKIYEGKWRKTSVEIETSSLSPHEFEKVASQWYQLNHPNVVKLFGACHIGPHILFVYEAVTEGRQLHDFLREGPNQTSKWKCLHDVALGLQYIHNRGIVHGDLRNKNIIVDSDLVVRLCGVRRTSLLNAYDKHSDSNWLSPELVRKESLASFASDVYAFGMCIWEAMARELPWKHVDASEAARRVRNGELPTRPAAMDDTSWDLITRMCTADPTERVKITFAVNRLKQLVFESNQGPEEPFTSRDTAMNQYSSLEEHVFGELDAATIPDMLRHIRSRCEHIESYEWMSNNVYPALEHIFAVLRERNTTPADVEVLQFCATLSRFHRYLRTAISEKSVYQLARSRQVAESHHLVYAELDRLLNTLGISESDPIRVWRFDTDNLIASQQFPVSNAASNQELANEWASAVSVNYFESPSASHDLWTRAGLEASKATPPWYLSLRDLVFSESDTIGQGSFGVVYKGSWLDTPVAIKFMGYEKDFYTISTDLLLHEVRVWHRLKHPHVLHLYGACHIDKRYFVCEYASNGDLTDYLKKDGNETLKWKTLYEVALGLQYLHEQNITHNDLKCDNIMVGADGKAKLIDFGLSCLLNEAEIQIDVKKMGAVNWRSPEYLAGERPSFASDVYSFAMCIIEVISGEMPWGRLMSAAQVRYQFKKGNTPLFTTPITEKQQNLIQLMTKFEPSERVRMGFVVDKLNEIAQEERASRFP